MVIRLLKTMRSDHFIFGGEHAAELAESLRANQFFDKVDGFETKTVDILANAFPNQLYHMFAYPDKEDFYLKHHVLVLDDINLVFYNYPELMTLRQLEWDNIFYRATPRNVSIILTLYPNQKLSPMQQDNVDYLFAFPTQNCFNIVLPNQFYQDSAECLVFKMPMFPTMLRYKPEICSDKIIDECDAAKP